MTTILKRPRTSSALEGSEAYDDVTLATGLLVGSDFGTTAGVSRARYLRPARLVVTELPPVAFPAVEPAAEVRALRDRITAHGLSRQETAQAIGVDRRSLSGYASGEIRPSQARLEALRVLADLADAVAAERPGRVRDILLSRRGRVAMADQIVTAGSSILGTWRAWVARSEATVSVTRRIEEREPLWAGAARALSEGRLSMPPRGQTVRSDSTYEMDLEEAAAFAEPRYESRRQTYR